MNQTLAIILTIIIIVALLVIFFVSFVLNRRTKGPEGDSPTTETCASCSLSDNCLVSSYHASKDEEKGGEE